MSVFMSSPAKLPQNPAPLLVTILAYIVTGELLLGDQRSFLSIMVQIAIEVIILFSISYIALKLTRHPQRLVQTLSALIGVSLIVSIVSLLIMSAFPHNAKAEQLNSLVIQINLILLFWNLSVVSLIFKRAFEISTLFAGFIAINYFIFYEFLLLNFF